LSETVVSAWLGFLASAAFLAGLAGGVHCAAMCGPIVAASASGSGVLPRWRRVLAYNAGRILSYGVAGALAGAFAHAGLALRGGVPAQSVMAAAAGAAFVLLALHLGGFTPVTRALETAGGVLWRRLQPYSKHLVPANTFRRAFGLGALWGWLPCGMVYAVLTSAVATADPAEGALVMLAFGLGTVPNLVAIAVAAGGIKRAMRVKAVRLSAAAGVAALAAFSFSHALHTPAWPFGDFLCRIGIGG
jgi:sulfite exporter TauE/SafE